MISFVVAWDTLIRQKWMSWFPPNFSPFTYDSYINISFLQPAPKKKMVTSSNVALWLWTSHLWPFITGTNKTHLEVMRPHVAPGKFRIEREKNEGPGRNAPWQLWVNHFQSNLHPLLWGNLIKTHNSLPRFGPLIGCFIPGKFRGRFSTTPVLKMAPGPHDFLCFEDLIPSDIKLRKLTQATQKKTAANPTSRDTLIAHFSSSPLVKCCFQTITKLKLLGHHRHSMKNTSQNKSWMSQLKLRRWVTTPTPTIFPHVGPVVK